MVGLFINLLQVVSGVAQHGADFKTCHSRFFSCFRRFHFLKHTFNFYTFPKWENAINTKYDTKPLPASAICEMWSWQLPRNNYRYDNPESSREDRLARNNANFFNISLAGFLFFLAFASSALCGDDKDFCTPAKKLRKEPLFVANPENN